MFAEGDGKLEAKLGGTASAAAKATPKRRSLNPHRIERPPCLENPRPSGGKVSASLHFRLKQDMIDSPGPSLSSRQTAHKSPRGPIFFNGGPGLLLLHPNGLFGQFPRPSHAPLATPAQPRRGFPDVAGVVFDAELTLDRRFRDQFQIPVPPVLICAGRPLSRSSLVLTIGSSSMLPIYNVESHP